MDLEESLAETYAEYVESEIESRFEDEEVPEEAVERLKQEKLDQLVPVLEEMAGPLQERTDREIQSGAELVVDILEHGTQEVEQTQEPEEELEPETGDEVQTTETVESGEAELYQEMNVWKTGAGEMEIKLENRDGELHKEAFYVAEQLGLIEEHGLEGNDLNAARQGVRENGFETDYGDLDTEVPEEMVDHLRNYLQRHGYIEDGLGGESFSMHGGKIILEDEDFRFPVWTEEGLSEEASVLGYVLTGNDEVVEFDGAHFQSGYWEAYQQLEEAGLVESGDGADRANRYRVSEDMPEDLRDELQDLVVRTLEGEIQIGNVDSVRNGEVTIRYNGDVTSVEEYNVDLGQKVAYDVENEDVIPLET